MDEKRNNRRTNGKAKKAKREKQVMNRYSAKLLFQFHVMVDGDSGKRRICEERIIIIEASSPRQALAKAKRSGKAGEFDYVNDEGSPVYFEFVGIMDLLELGIECSQGEVWYDIVERLLPSERRNKLIPRESKLNAFRSKKATPRRSREKGASARHS